MAFIRFSEVYTHAPPPIGYKPLAWREMRAKVSRKVRQTPRVSSINSLVPNLQADHLEKAISRMGF